MLDEYCGSPFWNYSVSWDTTSPRLSPCFRHTALVWVPCLFLWLWAPYHVYTAKSSRSKQIPWTLLNGAKFGVGASLLILQAAYLVVLLTASADVVADRLVVHALFLKCATLALSLYLDALSKNHGLRTSGVLFLFWLLLLGSQLLSVLLQPLSESAAQADWRNTLEIVFTALIGLQLGLNCWADAEPVYSGTGPAEKPCPELAASFLSRLCFFWFEGLARLGHRRPLQLTDLWDLPPENTSKFINPPFVSYWDRMMRGEGRDAAPSNPHDRNGVQAQASFKRKTSLVDLEVEYKPDLSDGPSVDVVAPSPRQPGSIVAILCRQFGSTFLFGSLLKLGQDLLAFGSPFILRRLIRHTQSEGQEEVWKGFFFAVALLALSAAGSLVGNAYFYRMYLVGLRVRTAVVGCIYRKALRVASGTQQTPSGEVVNLMSVDAQKLTDMAPYLTILWSAPLQIGLSLHFLYDLLGASVFAGLGVMILLLPVSAVMGVKVRAYQSRQLKAKDARIRLLREVLAGIKVIKLYAWEPAFEAQVTRIRDGEVAVLKESAVVGAVAMFVWTCAPVVVAIVTFAVFVLGGGGDLDAERAFVSLAYFNIMRVPLNLLPMMLVSLVQSSVSIKRINSFLNAEEIRPVPQEGGGDEPISIRDGSFAWRKGEGVTLRGVDLSVEQGQLVAVVGPVGCGKSSLLAALLGEIEKLEGGVIMRGSVAYTAQTPWVQSGSVRDNILFGRPFDPIRYAQVLEGCALGPDLAVLPAGDATEIGEKGVTISGGQKARVALARAVYANTEVYLLDDPLAAVDAHVGKHIFERVLGPRGFLGGKTRLLVTHGVAHLPQVDRVVVLEDGLVTEQGTYRGLLEQKGAFADFLLQHLSTVEEEDILSDLEAALGKKREELLRSDSKTSATIETEENGAVGEPHSGKLGDLQKSRVRGEEAKPSEDASRLVEDEFVEEGVVKWGVFLFYLRAIGWRLVATAVLFQLVFQGFAVGSNVWLAAWADSARENGTHPLEKEYLSVYSTLGVGQALAIIVATLAMSIGTLSASGLLHAEVLARVLRAPAAFFDTTPSGRVVNRLGKDVEVLDSAVSMSLTSWLKCLLNVAATMGVITFTTPIFALVVVPTAALYAATQRFYIASSRQLRRLESVSRSPIYSHFAETVAGATTVRAFRAVDAFTARSETIVDQNAAAAFPSIVSARFLAVLLEGVGNLVIFFAALFAVTHAGTLTPGLVGLSLSYALQITAALNWLVETTNNVENNLVAVERLKEYAEIPQEAPWDLDGDDAKEGSKPGLEWPEAGRIAFQDYGTKYREELEPVLHDLSFEIRPGEKIGVCGRTGAGKSSLALALFRLLEPTSGRIEIDGRDISGLGLHQLRRHLTVIPQDPFVFGGTIRSNLDPFECHSDDELQSALGLAHLRRKRGEKEEEKGPWLETRVAEGGGNLSGGERALLCLARALLRKSRILVLDEATSAVDLETDDLIQATIRKEFAGSSVITIAHRLNTILDCDRILVLEAGALRELDTPAALLANPDSAFSSLARDAGLDA